MERLNAYPAVTPQNWQTKVLETAEYERPASDETIVYLIGKMAEELLETSWDKPDETYRGIGRLAVLLPKEHAIYFPDKPFDRAHDSPEMRQAVAGEFGDLLWYQVVFLAERDIDPQEVMSYGCKRLTRHSPKALITFQEYTIPAIRNHPEGILTLDEFALSSYMSSCLSPFVKLIDPRQEAARSSQHQIIETASTLLHATAYILHRYCNTNLEAVVNDNYQKRLERDLTGIPQGQNVDDPRWQTTKAS